MGPIMPPFPALSVRRPPFRRRRVVLAFFLAVTGSAAGRNPGPASAPASRASADIQAEYQQRFAALDPLDVEGHYQLAEWCELQQDYRLLRRQALYVLKLDRDHVDAARLLEYAEQKRRAADPAAAAGEFLTDAQIQRLRFAELLESAQPPAGRRGSGRSSRRGEASGLPRESCRVRFGPGVLEEFLELVAGRPGFVGDADGRNFMDLPAVLQLQQIRYHTGDRFASRIEIAGDPWVFAEFRSLHPMIMRNCGNTECHGGPGAPVFRLRSPPPGRGSAAASAAMYTNFLLLSRASSGHRRLIDRDDPPASLLLEYGLPARAAAARHPLKIEPMFPKGPDDPRYLQMLAWIDALNRFPIRTGVVLPDAPEPPPAGTGIGRLPATQPAETMQAP